MSEPLVEAHSPCYKAFFSTLNILCSEQWWTSGNRGTIEKQRRAKSNQNAVVFWRGFTQNDYEPIAKSFICLHFNMDIELDEGHVYL